MIVVDVGWYRLAVDPEGVMINMNLRDFKKMLRICCNVIPEHSDKLKYLEAWYTYLSVRTDYDPIKRKRMKNALTVGFGAGVQVFAIDLDSFEKIIEIEYHTFNDLLELSLGHTLVFIGIEKHEEFTF